ncbi:MAG: CRTAC1 family protein [Acidobacteria bacterium]|nr:CRTAC1 family protein [Acidobacteriota bacterium]
MSGGRRPAGLEFGWSGARGTKLPLISRTVPVIIEIIGSKVMDGDQTGGSPATRRIAMVAVGAVLLIGACGRDSSPPGNGAPGSARVVDSEDETAVQGTERGPASSQEPIISAIETLESARDATCHSTASRFEDFVYGTPLTDEAREVKIGLQKALVRDVWIEASRDAARAGAESIGPALVEQHLEQFIRTETDARGDLRVIFPDHPALTISQTRLAQYSSIAYSLRAMLGVQQDVMVSGGAALITLEQQSVEILKAAVDAVSLCALMLADQTARERNMPELPGSIFRESWQRLLPARQQAATPPGMAREARGGEGAREEGFRILRLIIDEKKTAYRLYNGFEQRERNRIFIENIDKFYAIYPMSRGGKEGMSLLAEYDRIVVDFSVRLLIEAQSNAETAGHPLIRSADASGAVYKHLPHEIDDFEDVHFFDRLEPAERLTVESYDCDSYRDFGLHWRYLEQAIEIIPQTVRAPDPFAAEIIAETISQYGVLLLRVSGQIAKKRRAQAYLEPEDIRRSVRRIDELARRHHQTAVPSKSPSRIVSASDRQGKESRSIFFTDVTAWTGVDFHHRSSKWLSEFRRRLTAGPPTFSGGGVAAEDIDGDGDVDLLFVGGMHNALYLNDAQGRFVDIADASGIRYMRSDGSPGEARQPIIADLDNDGFQDLLITYVDDPHRVYRNRGDRTFEDVTERAGLGGRGLVAGPAVVFDFDGDGLLDIYIGYFGNYIGGAVPYMDRDNRNALPNRLFRNRGGMRFEDVTEGSGTGDAGWAQAISHADFNRDGRQDLIVANDFGRNAFLVNLGEGRFQNIAASLGVTKAYHSMNVGISDLNSDGYPDVYISNIAEMIKDSKYVWPDVGTPMDFDYRNMAGMVVKESNVLYLSRLEDGRLVLYEPSTDIERGPSSTGWAWDAEFFDFDNDGDDDLYVVNGTNDYNFFAVVRSHARKNGESKYYYLSHARESNVFFVNQGGKLRNVSADSGADFVGNSRSTAYLDWDGDGDLDIAVSDFHGAATMLRNNSEERGRNWLKIRLIGDPRQGTNRDAIGARIVATTKAGLRIVREIQGGSGYLSMNPKEQHFGLADARSADLLIVWPNGEEQTILDLEVNRLHVVRQDRKEADVAVGSAEARQVLKPREQ